MEKYTRQELNEILLSKKVEDFYFVITQDVSDNLRSDEEAEEMLTKGEMTEETVDKLSSLSDQLSSMLPGINKNDLNSLLLFACEVNHKRVVTKIDDETLYDVATLRFISLNKEKIVRFNNASEFYTNDNARPKLFNPKELQGLVSEDSVALDYDDVSSVSNYSQYAYESYPDVDLTEEFIKAIGLTNGTSRSRN